MPQASPLTLPTPSTPFIAPLRRAHSPYLPAATPPPCMVTLPRRLRRRPHPYRHNFTDPLSPRHRLLQRTGTLSRPPQRRCLPRNMPTEHDQRVRVRERLHAGAYATADGRWSLCTGPCALVPAQRRATGRSFVCWCLRSGGWPMGPCALARVQRQAIGVFVRWRWRVCDGGWPMGPCAGACATASDRRVLVRWRACNGRRSGVFARWRWRVCDGGWPMGPCALARVQRQAVGGPRVLACVQRLATDGSLRWRGADGSVRWRMFLRGVWCKGWLRCLAE